MSVSRNLKQNKAEYSNEARIKHFDRIRVGDTVTIVKVPGHQSKKHTSMTAQVIQKGKAIFTVRRDNLIESFAVNELIDGSIKVRRE